MAKKYKLKDELMPRKPSFLRIRLFRLGKT